MNLLVAGPQHPERVQVVHELTQAAFAPYAALARPSGALQETVDDVAADLAAGGALLAYTEDWATPLGALRWRLEPDHLWVKRVSVHPDHQGQGVGELLMDATAGIAHAHGRARVRLGVRHALERNRRWYERRGFRAVVEHDDWTELEAPATPLPRTGTPATLWKYEHPDHLQSRFEVDVVEEGPDGWWVRIPRFAPALSADGHVVAVFAHHHVGHLPRDRWWTAWWSDGRQRLKVDIGTPAVRRPDGDLEFGDLCLDVVVREGEEPAIVDEDEFADACYPDDLAARARAAADDVLARLLAGQFVTEPTWSREAG